MATKTVSLNLEAYERLRAARRSPSESFSQVILRARWPEETITGAELLQRLRENGPHFSADGLDRIERLKSEHRPRASERVRPVEDAKDHAD
jgi:predicted CopG family antitoxin